MPAIVLIVLKGNYAFFKMCLEAIATYMQGFPGEDCVIRNRDGAGCIAAALHRTPLQNLNLTAFWIIMLLLNG
jgi:hypothetical protein